MYNEIYEALRDFEYVLETLTEEVKKGETDFYKIAKKNFKSEHEFAMVAVVERLLELVYVLQNKKEN